MTSKRVLDQRSGYRGLAKSTHKINYHRLSIRNQRQPSSRAMELVGESEHLRRTEPFRNGPCPCILEDNGERRCPTMWVAQSGRPRPAWWGLWGPPRITLSCKSTLEGLCPLDHWAHPSRGWGGGGARAEPSRNSKLAHRTEVSNASPGSTLSRRVAAAEWTQAPFVDVTGDENPSFPSRQQKRTQYSGLAKWSLIKR